MTFMAGFQPLLHGDVLPHQAYQVTANQRSSVEPAPALEPVLYRGLAAHWPAIHRWSFSHLAKTLPDQAVKLVAGNRELGGTQLVHSTLHQYLDSLNEQGSAPNETAQTLYLKEFDLLKAAPALKQDLPCDTIFPTGGIRSVQSWIGPASARTGLHFDYLDNMAVQLVGRKRFYLVRPGVVERLKAVSSKYDAWATLSSLGALEVAALHKKLRQPDQLHDFFEVDLAPGDVLHVPAGWWHEVSNLTASVSMGGFYGATLPVLARWSWVCARQALHQIGALGRGNCTCHAR
jgi:hypothetical protein